MSKAVKVLIICGYAFLLFQYLRISLKPAINEIDIEYVYTNNKFMTKAQKFRLTKKYYNISTYVDTYKKLERFKTDLKFVLKFTNAFLHYSSPLYGSGQKPFIDNNCTYYNCFLTNHRNLLGDFRNFDAVLFDVENSWDGPTVLRDTHQKFIFMASESAMRFPLCDVSYEDFYNLTLTYRLDSDVYWGYFAILDKKGESVGPKINMSWITPMQPTPLRVMKELGKKTKAAAWFVSNCDGGGGRNNVTMKIQEELKKHNLTVDVYGHCGKLKCPKDRLEECMFLLRRDYYFYLAFENSVCEDYVTEKVLYPLNNYCVPIVYGGADYSRFLPPGSYINAYELNATEVVNEMVRAIRNPAVYEEYFRWHNYYSYEKNPPDPDVCKLCQVLNEAADKNSWHRHFRRWWNPDYMDLCTKGVGRFLIRKPGLDEILNPDGNIVTDKVKKNKNNDFL